MADEFDRIARLAAVLGAPRDVRPDVAVELGIGDDAAVLRAGRQVVWTIDQQVEGVHFRRDWLRDDDLGFRATVAAVSDVLAMGAEPHAALAAWTIPDGLDEAAIDAIARGQRAACERLRCPIVGGNLARGPVLSIATTAVGFVRPGREAIGRSGAHPGDRLMAVGALGEAALGLAALQAGRGDELAAARFVLAWRRPPVHLDASVSLARHASAMVDVSDGLAQDVGHLAKASELRAVLDEPALEALVDAPMRSLAASLGVDPLVCVLAGGEDYALVAAVSPDAPAIPDARAIGWLEPGEGVVVRAAGGSTRPAPKGFRHST
jgi:thiamine-monophosphate kinase